MDPVNIEEKWRKAVRIEGTPFTNHQTVALSENLQTVQNGETYAKTVHPGTRTEGTFSARYRRKLESFLSGRPVPIHPEHLPFRARERVRIEGDAAYVRLTRGYTAIIDASDAELVGRICWRAKVHSDGSVYAQGHPSGHRLQDVQMHRIIVGALPGEKVDHKDGNGLNNRRQNLRRCSNRQNIRNQWPHRTGKRTSKFKGVHLNPESGKYRAQIMCSYRKINLGEFRDEEAAARVYDEAARKLHGEFARLNFPDDGRRCA